MTGYTEGAPVQVVARSALAGRRGRVVRTERRTWPGGTFVRVIVEIDGVEHDFAPEDLMLKDSP